MSVTTLQKFQSNGGNARAKKLSKARRKEIAKKAADARWKDHQPKP